MRRRTILATGAALLASSVLTAAPSFAQSEFPQRPIQMIVPWGAGGGTDAVGRIIAAVMQENLGVPVNVVNRTGGSGVVGHSAIATAQPDGYTIGVVTIEIDMMHWQGLTDLTYEDFDFLGMVNADPAGIMVSADSEYETLEDLMAAVREQPKGTFTASGTGQGGIWHLGIAGLMLDQDLPPDQITWVPSEGAAPGITDMIAGGVAMVPSSLAEGRAMIEADRVRALATMGEERQEVFPDVPTLKEAIDSDYTHGVWRTIAAPAGLPDDVKAKLVEAVEAAYNSDEYSSFMEERGFGMRWAGPEEATEIVARDDAAFGETMKAAGLAAE